MTVAFTILNAMLIDTQNENLLPTASKLNAEFLQVASAVFHRYKFMLALAIPFGTINLVYAVGQ